MIIIRAVALDRRSKLLLDIFRTIVAKETIEWSGTPAAETAAKHEKIMNEASRLFRERGFSSVSVGDLMQAAGLTHGSFYNHFDSKQSLISECITHLSSVAVERIEKTDASEAGKQRFISKYLSLVSRDNPRDTCLMPSLGSEISREPSARPAMTRYIRNFIDTLTNHFPWPSKRGARREAVRMTASMVGAIVLARAVDDETFAQRILRDVSTQYSHRKNG